MDKQLMEDLELIGGTLKPSSLRGCDEILIEQPGFSSRIALWGGHLMSFIPSGEDDLLFQSENFAGDSRFSRIHMGVPVCWPWFGAHEKNTDLPAHGLARYFRWQLAEAGHFKNGDVKIQLKLASEQHPLIEEMWTNSFELRLVLRLGDGFEVNFSAANLSDNSVTISEALHTYFKVGNSEETQITGLDGVSYQDKFAGVEAKQRGSIQPCTELDRVYLDAPKTSLILDPVLNRQLTVYQEGAASTVVWNPGEKRAKARTDLNDEEYLDFVCVESANALSNAYLLEPGSIHQLKMKVSWEKLTT
ncbi:dihydroxy-acid dehydratase [Marinomonas sp. MED121]|uniref:D-hexose-6-phosphate mutarotase n=1 Tax=Marinomonas sp. MED121 TaxID=314277 RepID=UPI000068FB1A|nr:D-hexose-6-phosphate mutarotase [Marinomonas sp. MED121]EAQ64975.1 dihydroxy-acid dehydratase [Marinomonas sp. MED121]